MQIKTLNFVPMKKFFALLSGKRWRVLLFTFFIISLFTCDLFASDISAIYSSTRTDFRDETIYFVMTTRFYDGDASNNLQCWDAQSLNQGDPAWRGDFKGLIEKLDYIKSLGFTAIWITPVVENCSGYDYHGYHAINMSKVDSRYESTDVDFQDLIDAVHAKGMKIILDVVFNHTGNFGEENLCPMFTKKGDLSSINCLTRHVDSKLPANYDNLTPSAQYQARLALMKNTDGVNHDTNNYWHHFANFNWDDITCQWAQIAGDCVDLNTENPAVYNYIVNSYSQFIRMGVDGFRVDTGRHISRLVFNKVFNNAFHNAAVNAGNNKFFMFAEICTRDRNYWYRNTPAMSTPFYTWKDSKSYNWSEDPSEYTGKAVFESTAFSTTNQLSCIQMNNDNAQGNSFENAQPSSTNAFLNGNNYHTPDYSMNSGLSVIDFPMHWNFENAGSAFSVAKSGDHAYNDPTWNVVYVDSHDYAPDGAPEHERFAKGQDVWAENLCLMFTFRGIPCLYYGSEIEFKKGLPIDKGPTIALAQSGRAYYGNYITGDINVTNFGEYANATGNMAVTLKHPLSKHIQRLNKIRMAVPALRKGQYSTDGVSGTLAFKRRYTDATTDSYVLVAISGNATFSNILNGTYVDAITGDTKVVTNNTLTATVSGKGNMKVYVLNTTLTPAPGKVGEDGKYLYATTSVNEDQGTYPTDPETLLPVEPNNPDPVVPVVDPTIGPNEKAIFFEKPSTWGNNIKAYIYYNAAGSNVVKVSGDWPGAAMTNLGNGVYKYNFDGEISNWYVLFSDGSNQAPSSVGFVVVNGGYYTVKGYDHTVATSSGIKETTSDGLSIYSNEGILYINTPEAGSYLVYGIDGTIVRSLNLNEGYNTVSDLAKGVYIIDKQKIIVE